MTLIVVINIMIKMHQKYKINYKFKHVNRYYHLYKIKISYNLIKLLIIIFKILIIIYIIKHINF